MVASILVENNASLKATTKNGFTPLHIAAKYGNMNVAKILLQKDSKLDAQGKNDISPLHLACHYDHPNVANLLLEKGASSDLASQNGHTPLHIAARKNQMDIASTLLENGANPNAESKAGFTPLHLSAQKGHYDMTNLLIEHGADPNHKAKNGLTALHLCAQEDFIRVASILVKNGANVESKTETGYRPIHVAAHFGNLSMIRFLLKHNADIDVRTNQNYTPLHQAAQQGHAHIVTALLEGNASHKARTNDGLTALHIAQKLGYISVTEVLKGLSYDSLTPDNKNWEEKYKVIAPESLQETSFMSDSDDEGGSDALISEQPYRYLTADLMKSLRDDSLPIDVTRDDPIHRPVTKEEKQEFTQSNNYCLAENFDSTDGLNLGRLHFRSFLVSFLVDARGGAMKGCRHSGVRIIVPPRRATMPIRVTCRLIKPSKVANPPPLMEGEALATRIIEMGPVGATFLGPVLIDIPHFASIRGKEREIIILRSENGETWKEHDNSIDNDDTLLNTPYDSQMSATHSGRITRIVTTEFPQYFAIITRIKQEVHVIGAEGGILISSVANHVQAVFPPGALTKKIKVGLQAHVIPAELTAKLLGNCVAVSPVITIEPRRRKFHKPITLTIPVPQAANKGMINQYGGETPTLRLLCSIAGGTSESQWEDVTGSTPLTFMNDRVSFTTTVSARFWLMDCRNIDAVPKMATELYEESLFVPYITNFVIYSKRMDILEATLRILCMTDGKEGMHTLERQEEFIEIVKSRDVEALDGKGLYIEFSGNLVPVTKSGVQLKFTFKAFRQNRLSFHVKVKDPLLDPVARMLFMREPKVAKGEPPQQPLCVLNIVLPEMIAKVEILNKFKKDYEDSNIIHQKMDSLKYKYTTEQKEKCDEPKETTPSEQKFITDTLQKEQPDAVTIQESLAQKAACPVESVDASYPNTVVGQEQDLSPSVEKQTYSEKRKFWEDISRKRESYQRSESEVSRTSQLTINESDSEYLQNVVSEEDVTEIASEVEKSETMEDLNIPDISECSVAEKAHYFEEQIQKEILKISPKVQQQDSLKYEKERMAKANIESKEILDKEEKYVMESQEAEKITGQKHDITVKVKDNREDEEKEIKLITEEEKEKDESTQICGEEYDLSSEPVIEICKELLNREREIIEEVHEDIAKLTSKSAEQPEILKKEMQETKLKHEVERPVHKETVVEVKKPPEISSRDETTGTLEEIIKERKDLSGKVKEFLEDILTEEAMQLPINERTSTTCITESDNSFLIDVKSKEALEKLATDKDEPKELKELVQEKTEYTAKELICKEEKQQVIEPKEEAEIKITKVTDASIKVTSTEIPHITSVISKKKEFESRIPRRITDTKATDKTAKKDTHVKKDGETYTVTEKMSSEEVTSKLEEHLTTKSETQTFSKTFTDPQEAFKVFEDMSSTKKDFATVTSKVDHKTSSTLEKKEVVSSEITTGTDKIITHEEKECVEKKKSSESKMKKESPDETLEEKKTKLEKTDKTAIQRMSMNLSDGQEVIDASASESKAESKKEQSSKVLEDKEGTMTHETGSSRLRESDADVAIRIKKDISEKTDNNDDIKTVDDKGERVSKAIIDSDKIEMIAQGESHKEFKESFDVTHFVPIEKPSEDINLRKEDLEPATIQEQPSVLESLEERQKRKFREIEARTVAETLIQSIESEIEKRSATDLKSELINREYLDQFLVEGGMTDHEKLADDLTRKFESIMKRSMDEETVTGKADGSIAETFKLKTSLPEEYIEKESTRDSISISEDITKDEESFTQDKEESFPLSLSQVRLQDRDITISPSTVSEQIDFEGTADVDTNELEDMSKPTLSPPFEKQRLDASSVQTELLQKDLHSDISFPEDKIVSEISGARVLEILEPGMESQSRQDSVDVPSLEMDDHKISEQTSRGISSLHESEEADSLEKITQERDITISPSTVSEDTNTDYPMVQDHPLSITTKKEYEIGMKRADSFEIESPPMVSPRTKVHGLEIEPVNWMIGDEKIEISETLQPSQVFNQELEAYESMRLEGKLHSHEGSVDFEQESGTKSSEEPSVIESTKETVTCTITTTTTTTTVTTTNGDTVVTTSVVKSSKFTVIPISEQDFESELIENKLDISCQELVDTLQREYDAKTPTDEYAASIRRGVFKGEVELEKEFVTEDIEKECKDLSTEIETIPSEVTQMKERETPSESPKIEETDDTVMKFAETIRPVQIIEESKIHDVGHTPMEHISKRGLELTLDKTTTSSMVEEKLVEEIKLPKEEKSAEEEKSLEEEQSFKKEKLVEIKKSAEEEKPVELEKSVTEEKPMEVEKSVTEETHVETKKVVEEGKSIKEEKVIEEKKLMAPEESVEEKDRIEQDKLIKKEKSEEEKKPRSETAQEASESNEWTETHLSKVKPSSEEYKRHMEKTTEKHDKPGRSKPVPSDTCAFKIKKDDLPNVDLSARYAITVLDQVVKKEIAEVKESLEAAKQDLIEELSENSENVIQIKDSPSEFQFKLQPETIPNDLPFLYKPPSLEHVQADRDTEAIKTTSPDMQSKEPETSKEEMEKFSESRIGIEEPVSSSIKESVKTETETPVIETEKSEIGTTIAVHEDTKDDEEEHPSPVPASRSGSDVDNKDESSSLAPPYPVPRRRQKPARVSKRVTSDSEADVGSSSGDSSNYQSCDYDLGSGSRPSSSDIEALQSCGVPSATVSEYETAMMSIEHSSTSRPTSQEYHTAATTISSRESMKSLNSLSSGHLGSIDSTSELSETLVPSETDIDKEEIEENLECALESENLEHSDSSGSDMPIDETVDKLDSPTPSRMKRSSEMIFPQVIDDSSSVDVEPTDLIADDSKGVDSGTSAFTITPGTLKSVDIMTSRVSEDGMQSVCTQVISTQVTSTETPSPFTKSEVASDSEEADKGIGRDTTIDVQTIELDSLEPKETSSASGVMSESPEMTMQTSGLSMVQQASISTSSTSGMSFDTVVEKEKSDRHSPDSDSFELVDKPDIIDDFVVVEEVGREAEEYDSEGKSIRISTIPQATSKNYDRDLENLISENKEDPRVSTSQTSKNNELFEFESEESPPQASNEDQYSQSYSDEEQYEGGKKWIEMQFQPDARVYDIECDRGPLEDIQEEEITDFEAGSSRFGSLGSHKESIGSVGSMRGSLGSTPDYDALTGRKHFTRPSDHDNVSLSSLQEFEHLESTVAAENSRRMQCGSQDSINNGSLPRRYMTSRSGHGDDISLSSLKDFEGLEKACREAHLIELRAREEEDLLEHESPENKYKMENLARAKVETSTVGSLNLSTSGSDDYEKRIKEIDEIIRIAQSNVEKFDRQDDTTEDISQIEFTETEKAGAQIIAQAIVEEEEPEDARPPKESNVMETSTDSLELEDNADKKHHPLCRSSDSLEMKTTLDFPSLSSDSLNNVRDQRELQLDMAEQASNVRRISSDSLDMPLLEQHDVEAQEEGSESSNNHSERMPSDNSLGQTSSTETNIRNGKTKPMPSSGT